MEEGNLSNRHPLFLADGNSPVNPGAERRGMVMFVGMTPWGAWDKVRRRMEERGDTEPGRMLQWVMGIPEGGSSSGGNTARTHQVQSTKYPLVFLEGVQVIREIQGQHRESGAQRCPQHPGRGTEPRWIEPRLQCKGWDRNLPLGASKRGSNARFNP